jgi:hypothetical protein
MCSPCYKASPETRQDWLGCSWIIELTTTVTRKGKRSTRTLYFITTLRTAPEALLRRIRQGFRGLAYDIQGMLALGDVAVPAGEN